MDEAGAVVHRLGTTPAARGLHDSESATASLSVVAEISLFKNPRGEGNLERGRRSILRDLGLVALACARSFGGGGEQFVRRRGCGN